MKRHFMSKNPKFLTSCSLFLKENLKNTLWKEGFTKSLLSNEKLLKAWYLVALRVAGTKSSHTIAEKLILPAAMDMCEVV